MEFTTQELIDLIASGKARDGGYKTEFLTNPYDDKDISEKKISFETDEVRKFYNGLHHLDLTATVESTNTIEELKTILGFEGNQKQWIKSGENLDENNAKKFFFQRLLLDSFKDKDFDLLKDFNDELHTKSSADSSEVDNDSVKDLWLFAKFNQLKEDEKIPKGFEYRNFVGLVRKALPNENLEKKAKVSDIEQNIDTVLEETAATKIQKLFRGSSARKELNALSQMSWGCLQMTNFDKVTSDNAGFTIFHYNDLNTFSKCVEDLSSKIYADKLFSLIVRIEGHGYCVVTASERGVTKSFISDDIFKNIQDESTSSTFSKIVAKKVALSIRRNMIYDLDEHEVEDIAKNLTSKNSSLLRLTNNKEELTALLKTSMPVNPYDGVSFLRPPNSNVVSLVFNYSNVKEGGRLTGNSQAYVYLKGTNNCYIKYQVCRYDNEEISVYKNGELVKEKNHKRGDIVMDEGVAFLNSDGSYDQVASSKKALKNYLQKKGKNTDDAETILKKLNELEVKAMCQINSSKKNEPDDIETKMSLFFKGKEHAYNGKEGKESLGKKRVVNIDDIRTNKGVENDGDIRTNKEDIFVKVSEIKFSDQTFVDIFCKLRDSNGKKIQESTPFFLPKDGDSFKELKLQHITSCLSNIKELPQNNNQDKDEKLFEKAKKDCQNTKLILPSGNTKTVPENFKGFGSNSSSAPAETPSPTVVPTSFSFLKHKSHTTNMIY
jgi:hypothetical protein